MFRHILVAIDNSPAGEKVFQAALSLAEALGSRLMLLHVLSAEESGSPQFPMIPLPEYYPGLSDQTLALYEEQLHTYEQQGLERLQQRSKQAMAQGISTEMMQVTGQVGRTICRTAKEWKADLILVGRRGHSGLNELLVGSISNYVMHHAPCSVMVIHTHPSLTALTSAAVQEGTAPL